MDKADIQLLYEYDRWANHRALQAASALTAEQFTRDLGGSFPSVRETLLHVIRGEWMWMQYWKATSRGPEFLADLKKRAEALFDPSGYSDVLTVRSKWAEIEAEQIAFVDGLTDATLQQEVPFRNTQARLAHLMQHLANHSTYHRGQVATMLRQMGAVPAPTDFHEFLLEKRRAAEGET